MIEGIQILNETTAWTAGFGSIIGAIILGIIGLFFLILIIFATKERELGAGFVCFIIGIVLCLFSWISIHEYATRTQYQKYQVLISESVKMNEFNAKYKIIQQDGNIFTIKEKNK